MARVAGADPFSAWVIQDVHYVDTTFRPGDGATYRVVTWVARIAATPTRFFAIARSDAPLLGDFFPCSQDLPFVVFVERLGMSGDCDLALLWAGWRALLYLCGREDQVPSPALGLPAWRPDWYADLTSVPSALLVRPQR
jgi:hypothetical protein